MKKVKTFVYVFTNSLIPNSDYYKNIASAPLVFSLKYFLVLTIILNTISLSYISFKYNPVKLKLFLKNLSKTISSYPKDLVLIIKDGRLISTYNRPVFFWLDHKNRKTLLLVIDQTADNYKINQYRSITLVSSNNIIFKQPSQTNQIKILPLNRLPNQIINKKIVNRLEKKVRQLYSFITPLFILIFLVGLLSLITTNLFLQFLSLLIISLFSLLLSKLFTRKNSFLKTFKISLHSSTLPLVTSYILFYFNSNVFFILLGFLILSLVFNLAAIYQSSPFKPEKRKTHSSSLFQPSSPIRSHKQKPTNTDKKTKKTSHRVRKRI